MHGTPVSAKSRTLRVTTVSPVHDGRRGDQAVRIAARPLGGKAAPFDRDDVGNRQDARLVRGPQPRQPPLEDLGGARIGTLLLGDAARDFAKGNDAEKDLIRRYRLQP